MPGRPADTIFTGGAIVTMDPAQSERRSRGRQRRDDRRGRSARRLSWRCAATPRGWWNSRTVRSCPASSMPTATSWPWGGRSICSRCTRRPSATSRTSTMSSARQESGLPNATSRPAGWCRASATTTPCWRNSAIPTATTWTGPLPGTGSCSRMSPGTCARPTPRRWRTPAYPLRRRTRPAATSGGEQDRGSPTACSRKPRGGWFPPVRSAVERMTRMLSRGVQSTCT